MRGTTPKREATPKTAIRFLGVARQFQGEANKLEPLSSPINGPLYFFYFQAIELALKALLQSFGVKAPKSHKLTGLYEECRSLGLATEMRNIVTMLDAANEGSGLRYGNSNLAALPSLASTRETVEELIRTVETNVCARFPEQTARLGHAAKLVFVLDKPHSKSPGKLSE
jgi:HEPN domain-containing protein